MALATYSELQASIASWLFDRTDLADVTPDFIALAEAQFNRDIRAREMEATATLTANQRFIDLPEDYLEMRALRLQSNPERKLVYTSPSMIADRREDGLNVTGTPMMFCVIRNKIELYPTPSGEFDIDIEYYQKIPALSDAESTNWLLSGHPDIYLYGSLAQAAPYLHEDERVGTWAGLLSTALASLEASNERAVWNAGPLKPVSRRSYR